METASNVLNHRGLVLSYLGGHAESTGLEIARAVGITERAARTILDGLQAEGIIGREKIGRRNRYRINTALPVEHRGTREVTVGDLLKLLGSEQDPPPA